MGTRLASHTKRGFLLQVTTLVLAAGLAWSQWLLHEQRLQEQRLQKQLHDLQVEHAREVLASDASVSTGLRRKFDNRLQHEQALAEMVAASVMLEQSAGLPLSNGQMRQLLTLSTRYCSSCEQINETDAQIYLGVSTVAPIVLTTEQQQWLATHRDEVEYSTKQVLTQTKRDYDVCRALLRFWSDRLGITDPAREGKS